MAYQKKVLVLNDATSRGGTGIVKLTENGDSTTASVLLHGVSDEEKRLYLAFGKEIIEFPLSTSSVLSLGSRRLTNTLDCLITEGKKPCLFGSTTGDKYRCFNLADEYNRQNPPLSDEKDGLKKVVETADILEEKTVGTEEFPQLFVEKTEKKEEGTVDKNEKVTADKTEEKTEETKEKIKAFDGDISYVGDNFYAAVKPQLDEMFICYPTDTKLAELVPNSKWVRVTSEDDYYVVGLIFELDEPKFICYGIHGYFTVKPDADLTAISEWLPIDYDNAEGEGYWMIYQSATDGKTLKKNN